MKTLSAIKHIIATHPVIIRRVCFYGGIFSHTFVYLYDKQTNGTHEIIKLVRGDMKIETTLNTFLVTIYITFENGKKDAHIT